MKTLEDLKNGATINPGEVYKYASAYMDPEHIGHYCTDLYLKVNDVSRVIVGALDNDVFLSTFYSNVEPRALWYELPFCYIPGWTRDPWKD